MMAMFATLFEHSMTLFALLQSAGHASPDDLKPFHELVRAGLEKGSAYPQIHELYRDSATKLGLTVL
jgi:hypothetical protein